MNNRSIEILRKRFIWVSVAALFLAMFFIGGSICLSSYFVSRRAIRSSLNSIINESGYEYKTSFPDFYENERTINNLFVANIRDSSDYWVLNYDINNNMVSISGEYPKSQEQNLIAFSNGISTEEGFGHEGRIYYKCINTPKGRVVAFIDTTSESNALIRLLYITVIVCVAGLAVTYILVVHFSHLAVASEVENADKQKDFITNASHELKTPLAVIRANTEMSQMINGEDEWNISTLKQVDHMNGLIKNLVMISKAQELEDKTELGNIDVTSVVEESVKTFEPVASQEGITLVTELASDVTMTADASKIMQLTTILVDNAIKYCDEKGTVSVNLVQPKKGSVRLSVTNSYKDGENVDYNKFFERFYREDKSHNIDKGGYGIGLSIADNLCRQYKGSIKASWKNGEISFTCILN